MKKLLVILMLGAGFVTTASAKPYNCLNADKNLCCVDEAYAQNKIEKNAPAGLPITDGYNVLTLNVDLADDGSDGVCLSQAGAYKDNNPDTFANGNAKWSPNNWDGSAVFVPSSSVNKDNAIIIIPGNKDNAIITNN